ncbi:Glutamate synthase [NADPH] small chain [Magnetospirillum gryphiswaldense MSR-1 v2]|uniref:Glutamate synthase [NADPH] small chain n=1 Tax=Magnetospirillum gryphiswaldense (strain DSM 6361 / JCM 21280 / NBRC 15271 / MSR-1) TaxID=431944 RepID=V6F8L7_MAGGM|nr:NAD(P)-dependent oxidoreductase [Magnetospirillum gryphiswaldense]CDL00911.1 Glutamate synthase [NADPH] small chain [Magnetospirillum gryphiswaldense MSR-1 v2]
MTRKMLQFTRLDQKQPDKRAATARKGDFGEISLAFDLDRAGDQASRCEQCGIPFCQIGCPLGNNIPDWLMLNAQGRMEEAYAMSAATNTFPEICGRICPQDRLCEGKCVLEQSTHEAVTIGAIEKHVTEFAFAQGWVHPPRPHKELAQSIGIIGGGPGGLAAAEALRKKGYQVTVYDRHDRMGGLLIYGIPGFKLEKSVVERRTQLLAQAGIKLETGIHVGVDVSLAELRDRHDAVLIATGVYKGRELGIKGDKLPGIHAALDYLITQNKVGLGDSVAAYDDGTLNAKGKDVVVIGGGDTAMDCVRTAIRQGAKSVKCLYRRDRANMPGSQREVAHAEEEGVEFVWMAAPTEVLGTDKVSGVKSVRMHLGVADASGRQAPEPIDGSDFELKADMVIKALGFDPEDMHSLFGEKRLDVTRWGTLVMDERTHMTTLDGVFAAGDIVRGASLVVWAIKDGRDAALSIDRYIKAKSRIAAE